MNHTCGNCVHWQIPPDYPHHVCRFMAEACGGSFYYYRGGRKVLCWFEKDGGTESWGRFIPKD